MAGIPISLKTLISRHMLENGGAPTLRGFAEDLPVRAPDGLGQRLDALRLVPPPFSIGVGRVMYGV